MTTKNITKFFLFGGMLFSLGLIYIITRDLKDVLMVTSPGGAPRLATLKSMTIYPKIALFALFMIFYRKQNLQHIMMIIVSALVIYFIIFQLWLYPHITQLAQVYISLYFLLAELWGAFAIAFLFWALANQTFTTEEAKLAYPLMPIFPSLATYLGGVLVRGSDATQSFTHTMQNLGYVLIGALILFILLAWGMKWAQVTASHEREEQTAPNVQLSLSFKILYIFLIFILITALAVSSSLTTFIWKTLIKVNHATVYEYADFMVQYSYQVNYYSILIYGLTVWMIWVWGWFRSTLIAPALTFLSVVGLLAVQLFPNLGESVAALFHTTPPDLYLGWLTIHNIILAGITYTLFGATKNMAFIPLATTTRARGKATVDFLFAGFGATLASFILLQSVGEGQKPAVLLSVVLVTSIIWIGAVIGLNAMYKKIS